MFLGEQPSILRLDPLEYKPLVEPLERHTSALLPHATGLRGVLEELEDRSGKRLSVSQGHPQAVAAVLHGLAATPDVGNDAGDLPIRSTPPSGSSRARD